MSDIFDEVLADKKRLLDVAESNAKNKIIAAITPRIKELVEHAILGRIDENNPGDDSEDILLGALVNDAGADDADADHVGASVDANPMMAMAPDVSPTDVVVGAPHSPSPSGEVAGMSLPGDDGKVILDVDSFAKGGDEHGFELTPESVRALGKLVNGRRFSLSRAEDRVGKLERSMEAIARSGVKGHNDNERVRQIRLECENIYADVQSAKGRIDEGRATKLENRLEGVFHRVMENYSSLAHIRTIVSEMKALNHRAGKIKTLIEGRRLKMDDIEKTASLMKRTMALYATCKGLLEAVGVDDSVDEGTIKQVEANLATLYTEMRNMVTKKNRRIVEADEMDAGTDMDAVDAMDDVSDEGEPDAERVLVKLELPANLQGISAADVSVVDVEPAHDEAGEEGEEEFDMGGLGAEDDVDGGDELGDEDDAADLDDMDEDDHRMYEAHLRDDDIIEIDEAALRAEMKKMKKLTEAKKGKKGVGGMIKNADHTKKGGHGPDVPGHGAEAFGGASVEGDAFVDHAVDYHSDLDPNRVDESYDELDESEEDDEELDEMHMADLDEAEEDLDESEEELDEDVTRDYAPEGTLARKERQRNVDQGRLGEGRRPQATRKNGKPDTKLAESLKRARAELAEQRLFSTKLIALNKVLQVPGLTRAQRSKIVEALDKGRTVAEVEKTYSKIVETLKKRPMAESASRTPQGSASRATTSASASNEDKHPLLEKWNRIAFGGTGVIQG